MRIRVIRGVDGWWYVQKRRWWWPFWTGIENNEYYRLEDAKLVAQRIKNPTILEVK